VDIKFNLPAIHYSAGKIEYHNYLPDVEYGNILSVFHVVMNWKMARYCDLWLVLYTYITPLQTFNSATCVLYFGAPMYLDRMQIQCLTDCIIHPEETV